MLAYQSKMQRKARHTSLLKQKINLFSIQLYKGKQQQKLKSKLKQKQKVKLRDKYCQYYKTQSDAIMEKDIDNMYRNRCSNKKSNNKKRTLQSQPECQPQPHLEPHPEPQIYKPYDNSSQNESALRQKYLKIRQKDSWRYTKLRTSKNLLSQITQAINSSYNMDGNVGHRCDKTHKMFELDENDNCKIINNLKKKSKYHTSITNTNTFNTHKNLNTNTNTNPDIDNTAHIIKKINLKLNRNKLDLNKTSYSPTCEINNSNSSPFVKSYSNRNLNGRSSRNSKISHYVGYRHKTLESETPLSQLSRFQVKESVGNVGKKGAQNFWKTNYKSDRNGNGKKYANNRHFNDFYECKQVYSNSARRLYNKIEHNPKYDKNIISNNTNINSYVNIKLDTQPNINPDPSLTHIPIHNPQKPSPSSKLLQTKIKWLLAISKTQKTQAQRLKNRIKNCQNYYNIMNSTLNKLKQEEDQLVETLFNQISAQLELV